MVHDVIYGPKICNWVTSQSDVGKYEQLNGRLNQSVVKYSTVSIAVLCTPYFALFSNFEPFKTPKDTQF